MPVLVLHFRALLNAIVLALLWIKVLAFLKFANKEMAEKTDSKEEVKHIFKAILDMKLTDSKYDERIERIPGIIKKGKVKQIDEWKRFGVDVALKTGNDNFKTSYAGL